jgi:hypothetical protein
LPAAGFGVDLDRLDEALLSTGSEESGPVRVVVVGAADHRRLEELRGRGLAAVAIEDRAEALAWARAWGFSHVLDASEWVDAQTGASIASPMEERVDR